MAKLVSALDLGSSAVRREGSSPSIPTDKQLNVAKRFGVKLKPASAIKPTMYLVW